ncbi:MAG: arsenite methyltransferase [Armatimonadetes bacterium]|nr:arsenite methyltransferase [Armatimonadota bacterium]
MSTVEKDKIRRNVREDYANIATDGGACCDSSCCSPDGMGYTADDRASVPDGADLGLGCGNPQAIASLKPGETVIDLGSGGGFDCFLAARAVGETGRVIGVDMTPEMVSKARENAVRAEANNVEFRLGEIENLPVADDTADVVMSNCVINLSPDKSRVFDEALRVLKPGGRLAIYDLIAIAPLPKELKDDRRLYSACIAGAINREQIEGLLSQSGFTQIKITPANDSWCGETQHVVSASIEAVKP